MRILSFIVILIAGVLCVLPALLYGFPAQAADGALHAIWYTNFADQFWSGEPYPRWLAGMNGGLGSPAFFYYAPVSYYITSLLRPLFGSSGGGGGDPQGWLQLAASTSLAVIASGLCSYLWLKKIADERAALVAAVLYMAMPYHVATEIYMRGALAGMWTFVWMPLVLNFTKEIINNNKLAGVGLAVSYALLIMTHPPTTLIFSVVPVCYAFFVAETRPRGVRAAVVTIGAMVFGIGLAAIYLVPVAMMRSYVSMQDLTVGWFNYQRAFLFTRLSLQSGSGLLIFMIVTMMMIALAWCAFIISSRAEWSISNKRERLFWITVATLSVFMMTTLSKPLWQSISVLQITQFPWRFNAVLCVATAPLLALASAAFKRPFSMSTASLGRVLPGALALLIVLSWAPFTARAAWLVFRTPLPNQPSSNQSSPNQQHTPQTDKNQDRANRINKRLELHRDAPEYRPRWASSVTYTGLDENEFDRLREQDLERLHNSIGRSDGELIKAKMNNGAGRVDVTKWQPRDIALQVDTPSGGQLQVSQFYYPGWSARLTGASTDLSVQPSQPEGLVSIAVPSGRHQVTLRLERTTPERAGQLISLLFVVALCLTGWFSITRRSPGERRTHT